MNFRGKALVYGDEISTDLIFPGRYMTLTRPEDMALHAMVGLDPDFPFKIRVNSVMVVGRNFGCGSSREQAPLALKAAGVSCIVGVSFARIFFRNAVNIGLPLIECPEIGGRVKNGEELEVDLDKGLVVNRTRNQPYRSKPLPPFLTQILLKGGLIEYLNSREG